MRIQFVWHSLVLTILVCKSNTLDMHTRTHHPSLIDFPPSLWCSSVILFRRAADDNQCGWWSPHVCNVTWTERHPHPPTSYLNVKLVQVLCRTLYIGRWPTVSLPHYLFISIIVKGPMSPAYVIAEACYTHRHTHTANAMCDLCETCIVCLWPT